MYERFISSSMLTWSLVVVMSGFRGRRGGLALASTRSAPGAWCRGARPRTRHEAPGRSDVEVPDVERVFLDELAPRLDLVTHQGREHQVGLGVVLGANLQQRPGLRLHRRGPELVGVHLAKALVPVDRDPAFPRADEVLDGLVERVDLQFAAG